MGGTVDAESEVGVGSSFWIDLPIEDAIEEVVSDAGEQIIIADSTSISGAEKVQHTVLYIEDNPVNIKLVAQILGRIKHVHLLTAHTPELGIELALTRRPELILLDINMPGMDGYQVLSVLKTEENTKAIPVVALTANAMHRDIERGRAAGFADYLTKPIEVGALIKLVNQFLQSRSEET